MRQHSATRMPRVVPLVPQPATTPAVATANQLQEYLRASYGIQTDIRANGGVALVSLGRLLHVWVYPNQILWDSGHASRPTRASDCTTVPADQTERAAGLVAGRYHQIRSRQG